MTSLLLMLSLTAGSLFCPMPANTETVGTAVDFDACLPSQVNLDSVVVVGDYKPSVSKPAPGTTAKQRLIQLRAHCKRGKLVDGQGKQIYFYSLIGCWGNPPVDYLDLLQRQAQNIQRLKKRYRVIQILCNQSFDPRKII